MTDDTEEAADRRIRATFGQVDLWRRTPLFVPIVGAELRADDAEWPYLATSQLAKVGLDVAAEHLHVIQVLVEAGQILPFSYRSVLRTALVGATQTVWLLAPDRVEDRATRTRTLVAEMYRRHGQYLGALLELDDLQHQPRHANTQIVYDHVVKRAGQMGTIRTLADEKAAWNDTQAIEEAAQFAFADQPNHEQLVKESLTEWMAGSGTSHGLVWPMFGTAGTTAQTTPDADGRVVIEATGSLMRVENAYMLAYQMTKVGWRLLRRRGL
jgi:hypothetical protein